MPKRQLVREILLHCCDRLNPLSEQFLNVTALYPQIGELYQKAIRDAGLDNINARDFKQNKERLSMIQFLLDKRKDLDQTKRQELIQLIVVKDDLPRVRGILDASNKIEPKQAKTSSKSFWPGWTLQDIFTDKEVSPSQKVIEEARRVRISDSDFLLRLDDISEDDETLKKAITDTKNIAQRYIKSTISKLLKKLVHDVLRIQQEVCAKQIRREISSQAERDIDRFRRVFIGEIEEHSQLEPVS